MPLLLLLLRFSWSGGRVRAPGCGLLLLWRLGAADQVVGDEVQPEDGGRLLAATAAWGDSGRTTQPEALRVLQTPSMNCLHCVRAPYRKDHDSAIWLRSCTHRTQRQHVVVL
jgi:hypothetical protein